MSGNPRHSAWRSTPRSKRHRTELSITIRADVRAALDRMASPGTRSQFVETLIANEAKRQGISLADEKVDDSTD